MWCGKCFRGILLNEKVGKHWSNGWFAFLFPMPNPYNLDDVTIASQKTGFRKRRHDNAIMGKFGCGPGDENFWLKARVIALHECSWRVIRLLWGLGRGFYIISINKWRWNVLSVSHDWKSNGSREDALLFQPIMTGSVGCITENLILWRKWCK